MNQNKRDLVATPQRLWRIFQNQGVSTEAWQRALELADLHPSRLQWRRFLDLLMLGMGAVFLIAGIFFFFAFNWEGMSKWSRFAVVEGAVIIATVMAFIFKLDSWGGRVSLAAATMLMGLALGVIGQAYQTGADNWQLFQTWAMFITAWVLISRWNIMYLIWMILINLTIALYWEQVYYRDWQYLHLSLIIVNMLFLVVWDTLAHYSKIEFLNNGRWILYVFALYMLGHATFLMVGYIFSYGYKPELQFAPIIYPAMIIILLALYTQMRRDLLMLTFAALSLLVVGVSGIGRVVWETMFYRSNDPFFFFFIMAVITVGLTVILVQALRRLQKAWEV